ncbi:MAG: homocysteine S-methyltransferase [Planctomycetaceae bacterium]
MFPWAEIHARQGAVILDGGLATELEAQGHRLDDPLWSARLLRDDPAALRGVHRAYLEAGADCIISASYQATLAGFVRAGSSPSDAAGLLRLAPALAILERDAFAPRRALVATSIGPYGAARADGAEYTGAYDLDEAGLVEWHRERFHLLAGGGGDLLACETIPSRTEARALARLLREAPDARAWFTFSCRDAKRIADGTSIAECAAHLDAIDQVLAIGVNCTPPPYLTSLIAEIRRASAKPIVVYPNSGERYDAATRRWSGEREPTGFAEAALRWRDAGASLIGGCCRTGPDHVRRMRAALVSR